MTSTSDSFNVLLIRSAFYTPMLLTAEKFLPAAGVNVNTRFRVDENPNAMVQNGELDFAQLAPSAGMVDQAKANTGGPVHIASINERDGFLLIGREPAPNFSWSDVEGRSIVPASFAVQPEACLRYALHLQEISTDKVTIVDGLNGMKAARDAFVDGTGDYVQLQDPMARELVHAGHGHLVANFGDAIGPIAFSSIITSRDLIEKNPERVRTFMSAYRQARLWIDDATPEAIADAIRPWFESVDETVLVEAIAGYKALGSWTTSTAITRDAFDAAMSMMLHSPDLTGITERYAFDSCCNDSFAKAADAEPANA